MLDTADVHDLVVFQVKDKSILIVMESNSGITDICISFRMADCKKK